MFKRKMTFIIFIIFFFVNISLLYVNAIKNNYESLITVSYLRKKYMINFNDTLNNKINDALQKYTINKQTYYVIDNSIINDILYENLSNKINIYKKITLKKITNIKISNGQKIILINGKILLSNGKLINLSNSKLLKFNNHLLKNTIYISYNNSFLRSCNSNTVLFLSG